MPNLFDVLEVKLGSDPKARRTYQYAGKQNQIDFLLVSKALKDGFQDAGIERRGMFGAPGVTPFPSVTSPTTSASDHAAVWAQFAV